MWVSVPAQAQALGAWVVECADHLIYQPMWSPKNVVSVHKSPLARGPLYLRSRITSTTVPLYSMPLCHFLPRVYKGL
jgi:hypothetical protein